MPDLDTISTKRRSENMRRIRSKNTKPELAVRRLIHGLGYRYRLHRRDLPGHPDMVFPSRRKVILVHGCFWHQHGRCIDSHIPRSRRSYWVPKLQRNRERDEKNLALLRSLDWKSLVIWECQVSVSPNFLRRLTKFLG
ncbi:MAG: very short patch repair endonuclease [Terriglobia bacterium]